VEFFNGTIINVKNNGLLVVKTEDSLELEFSLKEVQFLNKLVD